MQLLWLGATGWAWTAFVTERVIEIQASPLRTTLLVLASVGVVGSASWAAWRLQRSSFRYLPLLVLLGLAGRQWHRHALRLQYEGSPPVKSVGVIDSLWHPVTTTDLALHYYTLRSNKLFAGRLRLVLLTDLHITPAVPRAYYEHVFEQVRAQDADLILLAGDYVSEPENIELMAEIFARPWPARYGAFAALGNHDLWTEPSRVRQALGSAGVTVLEGRCQHLSIAIGRVAICGTEAPWGAELSGTLDQTELNLAISHTPDNVYRLIEQGAFLIFSGHTHGGQLRVPGFGSVLIPSRFGGLFDQGHFQIQGSELFVSAGVGADMPPLRLYCQPEILVVDIHAG